MSRFKVAISTKWFYHLGSPIEITVKIKNTAKRDYYVLFRNTPFDSLHNDCFMISCNKKTVEYDSIYAKRTPVTRNNFVLVKAGKSKKITISLAERYYFCDGGIVTLDYKPIIFYTAYLEYFEEFMHIEEIRSVSKKFILLNSNEMYPTQGIKMRMEEMPEWNKIYKERYHSADTEFPVPSIILNKVSHHEEKKQEFRSIVLESHYEMIHYICHCLNELQAENGEGNAHYEMIFGEYEEENCAAAQQVFTKVLKAVKNVVVYKRNENFTVDAMTGISMDEDCYGYINKHGTLIYLCRPFQESRLSGADSRIGILFHELSHVYAGTQDIKMGTLGYSERELCIKLAKEDQKQAVRNADSYEFFLESRFLYWGSRKKWPGTEDVDTRILGGPSIVCFNNRIYLFYLNKDSVLKETAYDAFGYESPLEMIDVEGNVFLAEFQPETIVYKNIIYVFYIPKGLEELYYTRRIGGKWEKGRQVSYIDKETEELMPIKPLYTPHPTEYEGEIVLIYCKKLEDLMYMISGDGNLWKREKRVSGNPYLVRPVCYNPAAIVFEGTLYIVYTYYESSKIYYAYYNPKIEAWIMDKKIEVSRMCDGKRVYAESDMEIRGVKNNSVVYLLFRGKDGKLWQIQMNAKMTGATPIFTDYEAVNGSMEQEAAPCPISICSFAKDDKYGYLVYGTEEDGIFINRQMRI